MVFNLFCFRAQKETEVIFSELLDQQYYVHFIYGGKEIISSIFSENYIHNGVNLGDISGQEKYDAATANWGGKWRMPTQTEMRELINNCTWKWTSVNGVGGYEITSKKNSNSIFLPGAGVYKISIGGNACYYWTSTQNNNTSAYALNAPSNNVNISGYNKEWGHPVRPVCD